MSQKIEFVERAAKGETIASLCREFSVSRTTGHKWTKRFKEHGYDGLDDESRRPNSTPLATAEDIVLAVLERRRAHPTWGPEKLTVVLRRRFKEHTPSERTVARIIRRANLVQKRRKRRPPNIVERAPEVHASGPNDVWTVDFKGWWRARNGERCEPLTVRDSFSRLVFTVTLCSTSTDDSILVFKGLFRKYGIPHAIQCDNGIPFVAVRARAGLSKLSAWWVSLGIRIVRSRLACPQDNGAHERMHRDISQAVQSQPAESKQLQQRALDKWKQEFNSVRPHQALGGKTPAEVYKSKPAVLAPQVPLSCRPGLCETSIYPNGCFRFRSGSYFLSQSLSGYSVGIEEVDGMKIRAWFCNIDLGLVDIDPQVDDNVYIQTSKKRVKKVIKPNSKKGEQA